MIYIVEDDINIRQMESYALKMSGFEAVEFGDGGSFFEEALRRPPEIIILDIMLPDEDGLSILKRLRKEAKTRNIPVIIVSAKSSELDAVRGLDLGADDYITKPFGIMEFISRVKALLRRTGGGTETSFSAGGIALDDDKHTVTAGGQFCELTYKEYELLKYLITNQGIVLSRDKIMDRVWGMDYEGETRTVDMHIKTLRQKLKEYGSAIKTVRNVGYKME